MASVSIAGTDLVLGPHNLSHRTAPTMLADGRVYLSTAWWLATFPGLAILVTVLGINLFGDGLRDTLDPRLKL